MRLGSLVCLKSICAATLAACGAIPFTLLAQTQPQHDGATETRLKEITVSATRTERPVQDAPGTVTVIEAETIERNMMKDITDLIRYEPGVSVSNNPGRFGPNSFNIRGISGNRVLMQVDGIRLPDAFSFGSFSSASRNMIDIDALKAVEILRGSGSNLYGSDAIGGVVTYLTKNPADFMKLTDKPVFASLKGGYASADNSLLTTTATVAAGRGDTQGMLLYTYRSDSETENKRAPWIAKVRDMVSKATQEGGRVIVIPARTTARGPEQKFLAGLNFETGTGFAPHPLFARWVEKQVQLGLTALGSAQATGSAVTQNFAQEHSTSRAEIRP